MSINGAQKVSQKSIIQAFGHEPFTFKKSQLRLEDFFIFFARSFFLITALASDIISQVL